MIVFDLKCEKGHGFEEWFASSSDFEAKREAAAIACPECGDTHIEKGLMAPHVNGGASAPATPCGMPACSAGGCAMLDG
ncbi:MAG: DUF1178 family protein [Rhodospirillales bacterium]